VLPTEIGAAVDRAAEIGAANDWSTHARVHAHGLGRVIWDIGTDRKAVPAAVESLRYALAPRSGTVLILDAPLEIKRQIDVWGSETDAVPVMRRVKAELDPRSTLNPGRLIGGI
jgi:glycolate oxidase FAD binding subunit